MKSDFAKTLTIKLPVNALFDTANGLIVGAVNWCLSLQIYQNLHNLCCSSKVRCEKKTGRSFMDR